MWLVFASGAAIAFAFSPLLQPAHVDSTIYIKGIRCPPLCAVWDGISQAVAIKIPGAHGDKASLEST
jgi:hypothetical protein